MAHGGLTEGRVLLTRPSPFLGPTLPERGLDRKRLAWYTVRMLRRLRRWAEKIGRWLAEELLVVGAIALAAYLEVRSRKFARQAREASGRRARWLSSRAARWRRCAKFLRDRADEIAEVLTRETLGWVTEGLADPAADEIYG